MHGGLILTNPELTGCQPLIHLIKSAHNIVLIANTGTGILFRLIVGNDYTVYTNAYGVKVNSFIIKIVIITDKVIEYRLGERSDKRTETFTDFLNESRVQQQIWIDCINESLPEFIPSVANLSIFDNIQSKIFLNLLLSRNNKLFPPKDYDSTEIHVLIPAVNNILTKNPQSNIGVLLMPDMTNTITLREYLRSNQKNLNNKLNAYVNTIVNVLRLYLFHDIIHLDLHSGNVLISNVDASSFIIDFGYITNLESNNISKKRKRTKRDFVLEIMNKNTPEEKIKFVNDIIQFIQDTYISKNKNSEKDPNEYHGIKWINEINNNDKTRIFVNAFDKLKIILENPENKENQENPKNIFNLDSDNLKTYYCNENIMEVPKSDYNPYSNTHCKDNVNGCTISGGKIRTYVSKRKKKPKKTQKRNQRKHKKENKKTLRSREYVR